MRNLVGGRAHGHANADFLRALRDGKRDRSVKPNDRETGGQSAKNHQQKEAEAPGSESLRHRLFNGLDFVHRNARVQSAKRIFNRLRHACGITLGANHQPELPARLLILRYIDLLPNIAGQIVHARMLQHADNLSVRAIDSRRIETREKQELQSLADRIPCSIVN